MTRSNALRRAAALAALCLAATSHAVPAGNNGYDPKADPAAALKAAEAEAKAGGKLVLVEAGGAWCRWCWAMDAFLKKNPDLETTLESEFVKVKVYYGDENENKAFFATLPKAKGYPQFWIVDADGKVLQSVDTGKLEDGKDSYDRAAFQRFLREKK